MINRIYVVIEPDGSKRLVEAVSQAQAIRHCVSNKYAAAPASPKDVADLMSIGTKIERANEPTTHKE